VIQASPEFIEAMKQPIKDVYIKLEFYTSDMQFLGEFTKKVSKSDIGSINVDRNRPIRRSFTLTLDNKNNEFIWGENSLVWIDKRIKLFTGLKIADGSIHYVPQGLFVLTEPSDLHRIGDGKKAIINCVDKAYLYTDKRGKLVNELIIEEGTPVKIAIQLLFEDAGETMFNFDDDIDAVVPYEISFSGTDNIWKVGEELAIFAQADLFYDVYGYLRLKKIDLNNLWLSPPTWIYKYGDKTDRFYAGNVRRFDDNILANHIRVLGGSSQTAEVLFDLKVDENDSIWENNPYRVELIGEWTYFHNNNSPDPLITTYSEAFWRAKYELMNRLGYTERTSIQIAPNYLHDASDIIEIIDDENKVNGRYLIESFNLPIVPDLVTVECRKEQRIVDNWDFIKTQHGDIKGIIKSNSENNYTNEEVGFGDGYTRHFQLDYFPVKEESVKIYINGIKVDSSNYIVHYHSGVISFKSDSIPGENKAITADYTQIVLLEGVKLQLSSVSTEYTDETYSNFFGNYRFIKVPEADDYVITASLEGYQEKIQSNVEVVGGDIVNVDLEMVTNE